MILFCRSSGKYPELVTALVRSRNEQCMNKQTWTDLFFREYSSNLRRKLKDVSFQHLRLDTRQSLDWRVDYVLQSSEVDHVDTSVVRLSLPLRRPGESIAAPTSPSPSRLTFDISHEKLEVLVHELRKASILMKDVAEKLN